jgi:Xaa-Pro aminopeptidase
METMQPTLKNGRNVWGKINMPALEFQERVRAIREKMQEQGIDVLLAYGTAFNEYGNPCYLSNYVIRLPRGSLVATPRKGEVTLFFEGASRGLPSAKMTTWIEDVRACPDVSRGCAEYLKENGLIPGTIGFAGLMQLMPHYQLKFLTDNIPGCDIVDADSIIRELRMVKSNRECDQIRRSSRIVKHAFDFLTNGSLPDMNERAVEAAIYREARLEGAEDVRILLANSREDHWALRLPEDAPVAEGQTLIVYLAIAFERYWSEGIRTFVVQNSSLSEPELENAKALYKRITDEMKPGKTVSQFYQEAIKEIQKDDIEFISEYGLGEGIGLSLNELPALIQEDTNHLEEGMCLTLRLALKYKSLGGVMIGSTLLVTSAGAEPLTT